MLVISALIKIIIFSDSVFKLLVPEFLSRFFVTVDVDMIECQNQESLFQSVSSDENITHFIIVKSSQNNKELIDRIHSYDNVKSIYIYCNSDELKSQRRLARNYSKLDAVFDDPRQILIKLLMDMALFCEEMADREKDESSVQAAHRNYQRSIDLYTCANSLI